MSWPDIYLLCFAVGALWSIASLLLGGLHLGHSAHTGHVHLHAGHSHTAHAHGSWIGSMINPSCAAVFLAWFGGIGYLLTRHTGLGFWVNLAAAVAVGLTGAWILASFLRFLQSREQPLDPGDYDMVGVLGRVSCAIRPERVGEIIYIRDGARKAMPARSEEAKGIARDEEVIVTRYEKGTAYVRTWDAMTRFDSSQKETEHVE
jgi:membrane protein implicated in regulation of membrane protease activity